MLACGCEPSGVQIPAPRNPSIHREQQRTYPEAGSGAFVSLADFEPSGQTPGAQQVRRFRVVGQRLGEATQPAFVVNITRTGTGALRADLSPGSVLQFDVPSRANFPLYTLLSVAIHSSQLRDDLRISFVTDAGTYAAPGQLVEPGWNVAEVDLRQLAERTGVDLSEVRQVEIDFPHAAGLIPVYVDDMLLIDNSRQIAGTPRGLTVRKVGLWHRVYLPGWKEPVEFVRSPDGLWRGGENQPRLTLTGSDANSPDPLAPMGPHRVGDLEVVEINAQRVQLRSTWYFPPRSGEWASKNVARVRWLHTFYADGRWVIHTSLSAGRWAPLSGARIELPRRAAWTDGVRSRRRTWEGFGGIVGRWSCLIPPRRTDANAMEQNFSSPGGVKLDVGQADAYAPGDVDRDRFDETQGCYFLRARDGQCRFTLVPFGKGLVNPAVVVSGGWTGEVSVSSEGLAIRDHVRLADGSVLLRVPGTLEKPTSVEVTGPVPLVGD